MKVKSLSRVRLLATPRTAAYQAPLSMGFSRVLASKTGNLGKMLLPPASCTLGPTLRMAHFLHEYSSRLYASWCWGSILLFSLLSPTLSTVYIKQCTFCERH